MPEDLPDRMPDRMSEDMPEDMPDKVPEDMPEHMPEDMPGRMPEDMPDSMPEDMPDKLPEDMSDRMPEDFPVTKRIDVMVGITRSKVILVVWVRLLLCCLRHCLRNAYAATVGAYAAHPFEGVPTQAQRPHKATPQCMFCLRRHTSVCFWKVGNGTFAYATTVPFTFLQHERPGSKAPIDILQPHPCAAAAPATRSQSAH